MDTKMERAKVSTKDKTEASTLAISYNSTRIEMGSLRDLRRKPKKSAQVFFQSSVADVLETLKKHLDKQVLLTSPPYFVNFDIESGGLERDDISVSIVMPRIKWDL